MQPNKFVISAKAGIQATINTTSIHKKYGQANSFFLFFSTHPKQRLAWIPAFAGMTSVIENSCSNHQMYLFATMEN